MQFLIAESLKEVRELLPPNHCIKQLDENIVQGQQKTGDYFMVSKCVYVPSFSMILSIL